MLTFTNTWLRRLSKINVFSTLFLIFAGALVKSHEVGLSVPDWPTTYGHQMFAFPLSQMVGGIFYEHGHRLVATLVGFITLVLVLWIGFIEKRLWVRKLGYATLAVVVIQGLFGGITVLYFLPPTISIIHGILAQTFFILTIILSYSFSKERHLRSQADDVYSPMLIKGAVIVGIMVYVQLILGALMRHTASGMAIPDFPLMGGYWLPPFNESMLSNINDRLFDLDRDFVSMSQVVIHFLHRLGGVVVFGSIIYFSYIFFNAGKQKFFLRSTMVLILLVVTIQVSLGAFTVLSDRAPYIASFHVVTGAALLGLSTLMVLRLFPLNLNRVLSDATEKI